MVAVVLESGAAFPPWFLLISAPFLGARSALTAAFQPTSLERRCAFTPELPGGILRAHNEVKHPSDIHHHSLVGVRGSPP